VTIPETNWVVLARIVRSHGRRGEVIAELLTDFPQSFSERKRLFLQSGSGEAIRQVSLEAWRLHQGRVLLKFAGTDSIDEANQLRDLLVVLPIDERMPLTEDAVYVGDLVGAQVVDIHGGSADEVGTVAEVLPEGAGPAMLVIRAGAGEPVLIPFVKAYLKKMDLAAKRIEMDLPEGLLAVQAPLTAEQWRRLREEERSPAPEADRKSHALRHR
jgi:16S rRNA processing protein RimM